MSLKPIWAHPGENPVAYRALCDFVSVRIWGRGEEIPHGTAMAVVDDDVVAAVAYSGYQPDAGVIEMHAASDTKRWLTRPILFEMFDYPFNQLGCQAVVLRIAPDNAAMIRIAEAYGFSVHEIPRLRGRDEAETVCVLGDDVWRSNGFHRENAEWARKHQSQQIRA